MAAVKRGPRPLRTLVVFLAAMVALIAVAAWPGKSHAPRLGLDLQGGTQVTLIPSAAKPITDEQMAQTVDIVRARVNGLGVAEAEVSVQGSGSSAAIVVSVPGSSQSEIADQIKSTALLDFRPVLSVDAATAQPATSGEATTPTASGTPSPAVSGSPAPTPSATSTPSATPTPSPSGSSSPATLSEPVQAATQTELEPAYLALNCAKVQATAPDDPGKYLATCSADGQAKYLLGPAFIRGTNVTDAQATLSENNTAWVVSLRFDDAGAKALADVSSDLASKQAPNNQFAIVLDGKVQSSPYFSEPILGGQAQISGQFDAQSASALAQTLKFGALPVTLTIGEVSSMSPTLGADQLHAGLLAGGLGLLLVALYLLIAYRMLGVVAIASLLASATVTYAGFVILGRTAGLALTLAGVSGAIVAIGITADSFIVYFERVRDEVRAGSGLRRAFNDGWASARRTVLAADFVSLLAAVVLYMLSVGNVRGFAFVLGVTTLIDVAVAFMFTRPVTVLMLRWRWFAAGSRATGVDVAALSAQGAAEKAAARKRADALVEETADV